MNDQISRTLQSLAARRTDRRAVVKGAAAGLALGAFGLGRSASAQESTPATDLPAYNGEEVTITYGYWDSTQTPGVEAQLAAFKEKFPNITVEPQITPWADYWTKLQTSVAGGQAFDVFWLNAANVPIYASQGALLSSQPLIDAGKVDPANYPDSLKALYAYNGEQFGIPRDFDTIGLFYNKDLFDKAGLDYPTGDWTWDDFRTAAEALTDADSGIWGAGITTSLQETWGNFIYQNDGHFLSDDLTTSALGEPEAAEALAYLANFFTDNLTPSIAIQQANAIPDTLFPAGQVALLPGGSWRAGVYAQADANIDVAPLPKGKKAATIIHGLANVAWSGTQQPGAVYELLNFFASEEAQTIFAQSGTGLPAFNGIQNLWVDAVEGLDAQVFIDAVDYSVGTESAPDGGTWINPVLEVIIDGFSGNIPAEEIGPRAAEAADAELAAS